MILAIVAVVTSTKSVVLKPKWIERMNRIDPRKLLNSKWTAAKPSNKEKHFLVTDVEFDDDEVVVACAIEAIISKRTMAINWHDLKDSTQWLAGWK
jgi:tryptophan-rich hypothetical protein